MRACLKTALLATSLIMTTGLTTGTAQAQGGFHPETANPDVKPAKPEFAMGAMNVFRRFDDKLTPAMVDFYHKALGLRPLQPIQLSANEQMILFGIGKAQIKLAAGLKQGRDNHQAPLNEATGIRFFGLTYPDEAAVTARFRAAGLATPAFEDIGGSRRAALVSDPAGFLIRLIIDPAATAAVGVNVGINVSDIERSRAFYRSFVELEELPPVQDKQIGAMLYTFRNGETSISLWSKGEKLKANTGSAGIQYVINNVDAVNARAMERKIAVEEPLGGLPNFSIRFVWLNDPDGVTNYFAQVGPRPAQSAAKD